MTVSTTVQKTETINLELQTPAFFKLESFGYTKFVAIYSEDHTVSVDRISDSYCDVTRAKFSSLHDKQKIVAGESVTEQEFNDIMCAAISEITRPATQLLQAV